ncbi:protein of unknown function [Paraburkholderia dioscoreae]|uniref:Uncharacterized protein n=1 Tax=Paraburkholderia dioscoreae TaxID=2604047 RepID=A0A5Q4YWL2_9BURK|nr:protein of unknown function [Paraburkholderia dioscoreae]
MRVTEHLISFQLLDNEGRSLEESHAQFVL